MPYDDEIFEGIGKPVAPPGSRTPVAFVRTWDKIEGLASTLMVSVWRCFWECVRHRAPSIAMMMAMLEPISWHTNQGGGDSNYASESSSLRSISSHETDAANVLIVYMILHDFHMTRIPSPRIAWQETFQSAGLSSKT